MPPPMPGYWDDVDSGLSEDLMGGHYAEVLKRMDASTPGDEHIPQTIGNPKEITTEDGIRWCEIGCGEAGFLGSPDGAKTSLEVAYLYRAMKQGLEICDQQEVLAIRKESKAGETRYCVNVENHRPSSRRRMYWP